MSRHTGFLAIGFTQGGPSAMLMRLPYVAMLAAISLFADAAPSIYDAPTQGVRFSAATAANIAGEWSTGSVSAIQYRNRITGESAPTSGSGFSWTFNPNGTFEYAGLMQQTMYHCTTSYFTYETGKWALQSDKLTVTPIKASLETKDNCGKSGRKATSKEPRTYTVAIGKDSGGTWLYLRFPDGGIERYSRGR